MKKHVYLFLFIIIPFFGFSQTQFRSGIFLHHSTGLNIWGPNSSSTSIVQEMTSYNNTHGYTGSNAVTMSQQWFPIGGNNEWEYWHRIFEYQTPEANIQPILYNNKIVVIKSCFDASELIGQGQPSDTLNFTLKTIYNYKWHWRHIIQAMARRPQNFFAIWTNAPLTPESTNPTAAALSKQFSAWAKDTLARGLDPVIGAFPPNIYVFHYFNKTSDDNGYELLQYAMSPSDSHPNDAATALIAPQFVNEIFTAAIAYEQGGATLSADPAYQQVSPTSTSADYQVTSNSTWTTISSQDWLTLTPSGTGNGNLSVVFAQNPSGDRSAAITVFTDGAPPVDLIITQTGASGRILNLNALVQGLYIGNGTLRQANDATGAHFGPGIADLITVELHNASNYDIIAYSFPNVPINNSGHALINLPSGISGSYYITLKHRNSIETTSANPVSFANPQFLYEMNLPSKVFGNNLLPTGDGRYVIFGGDVNQDGIVDTADLTTIDNNAANFMSGYLPTDVNCDGAIDTEDFTIVENNSGGFISSITP